MKRFLYVVGALNVVWLLVSLGGVAVAGQLDFWTWNLMGSLLAMVVLAPVLVFVDSGLGSRSGSASSPSPSAPSSADPHSSPDTDASDAGAFAPARPAEPAGASEPSGASEPAPSTAASSAADSPAVDEPVADESAAKQHRRAPNAPTAASPAPSSPSASTGSSDGWASQLLFYAGSVLLLLWIGTSITGLFVDRGNLTFWTWSVMWALLATVLWAPIVVFVLDPFNRPEPPRAPSSTDEESGEASPSDPAPQESATGDSAEPFVVPDAAPNFQDADAQDADAQDADAQEDDPLNADADASASTGESSDARRSSESPGDLPTLSARTNPRSTEDWNPWPPEEDAKE